jgi:hypothetical protein
MTKFHVSVKGQAIDGTWEQRLDSASKKFGEIKTKMREWVSPAPAPVSAPETPAAL